MPRGPRHTTSRRRALAQCRDGRHRFGKGVEAGGGVVRRTCLACGSLSIDLTGVEPSRADGFAGERTSHSR